MPASGVHVELERQALSGKVRRVKGKADTHDKDGVRVRYFADDDKTELKDMIAQEKKGYRNEDLYKNLTSASMDKTDNEDFNMDDMLEARAGREKGKGKQEQINRSRDIHGNVFVCVYYVYYVYIYIYVCVRIDIDIDIYIYMCVCVCMRVYIYIYICVCVYVCVCIYIYLYIHIY